MGGYPHARRHPVHRLVMGGIDSQRILAEEFVQDTPLFHADPVQRSAAVLHDRIHLRRNILDEGPAQDDIQQLFAPADAQDGFSGGERRLHQEQVADIPERVHLHRLIPESFPVIGRVDIRSPGENDRVHRSDQGFGRLFRVDGRENHRHAPGTEDGIGIIG